MHRKTVPIILALVVCISGSILAAERVAESAKLTVGEFATRLVTAVGRDASTPTAVRDSLFAMGYRGVFDADAPFTSDAAHRIAMDLGVVVVTPSNPSAQLSQGQATSLVGQISRLYVEHTSTTSSGEGPTQCLTSENRGACNNCCKDATGDTGQFCGRFCHANVAPGPSPEEPLP
jgi:hypothetical protein